MALTRALTPTRRAGSAIALLVADSLGELPTPSSAAEAKLAEERRELVARWERKFVDGQAEATAKAVRSDWQVFFGWCQEHALSPLPASTRDFVRFLAAMIRRGRRRATLNRYIYTVEKIHAVAGVPAPTQYPDWDLDWKVLVRRLAKLKRNGSRQAEPLKAEDVATILASLGDRPHDLRDAALLSLASDTLCRESELAVVTLAHLKPTSDSDAWTLEVEDAKNDQEALGGFRFVSADTKARIDAWCRVAEIREGFLFLPIGGGAKAWDPTANEPPPPPHLRPAEIAKIFRRRAKRAGLDRADRVSGHSARVGSTIDLMEQGFSTTAAQFAGGWQSERMVLKYGKRAKAGKNAMAELRARRNEK